MATAPPPQEAQGLFYTSRCEIKGSQINRVCLKMGISSDGKQFDVFLERLHTRGMPVHTERTFLLERRQSKVERLNACSFTCHCMCVACLMLHIAEAPRLLYHLRTPCALC